MATADTLENKDQKVEKSSTKSNKSQYSKQTNITKNTQDGIANGQITFTNPNISIKDMNGNVTTVSFVENK